MYTYTSVSGEGGKGGGGEFQSHITRNFSIESRITEIFLTNQASRKEESVH